MSLDDDDSGIDPVKIKWRNFNRFSAGTENFHRMGFLPSKETRKIHRRFSFFLAISRLRVWELTMIVKEKEERSGLLAEFSFFFGRPQSLS